MALRFFDTTNYETDYVNDLPNEGSTNDAYFGVIHDSIATQAFTVSTFQESIRYSSGQISRFLPNQPTLLLPPFYEPATSGRTASNGVVLQYSGEVIRIYYDLAFNNPRETFTSTQYLNNNDLNFAVTAGNTIGFPNTDFPDANPSWFISGVQFDTDTNIPDLFKIGPYFPQSSSQNKFHNLSLKLGGQLYQGINNCPILDCRTSTLKLEFKIDKVDGFIRAYVNNRLEIEFIGDTNPLNRNISTLVFRFPCFNSSLAGIRNLTIWDDVNDGSYFVGNIPTPFDAQLGKFTSAGIKNETTPVNASTTALAVAPYIATNNRGVPLQQVAGYQSSENVFLSNTHVKTQANTAQQLFNIEEPYLDEVYHVSLFARPTSAGARNFNISSLIYQDSQYKKGQDKLNIMNIAVEGPATKIATKSMLLDVQRDVNDEPWTKEKVMETQFGFQIDAI